MTDIIQAAKEPLLTTLIAARAAWEGDDKSIMDRLIQDHIDSLSTEELLKQRQMEYAMKELAELLKEPFKLIVNPNLPPSGGTLN